MLEASPFVIGVAVIGAGIMLALWLPRWVSGREPAASTLLILAGLGASFVVPGLDLAVSPVEHPELWEKVSSLAIVVALFGGGIRIDRLVPRKEWMPTVRLLLVAMPLCIAAVTLFGWLFAGLSLAAALLLGAALAPTDPVLAGDVQVGPPLEGGEHPVRFTLTAEASLNDGFAFPFVMLALLVAGAGWAPAVWGVEWLAVDVLYRIVAGTAGGVAVGWLLAKLLFAWPRANPLSETNAGVVALAGAMLAYGLTEMVHGYGFVAAFVAGLTVRRSESRHEFHRTLHDFLNALEHAFSAVLLIALGAALPALWPSLGWRLMLVGAALIFIIRPATGLVSLLGTRMRQRERIVVAFYGVRGIGTLYYLAYALGKLPLANRDELWAAAAFTIALSTLVHGLTAGAAVERATGEVQDPKAPPA